MRMEMLFTMVMIGASASFGETTTTAAGEGHTAAVEARKGSRHDGAKATVVGEPISETRSLSAFNVMHVRAPVSVSVKAGERMKCTITGDKDVVPRIVTEVDAEELMIRAPKGLKSDDPISILIEMPRVKAFDALLQSAGNVDVRDVAEEALLLRLEGTGNVTASGKVEKLEADLSGAGNLNASALEAGSAEVTLSGTGNISVHVTKVLDANLKGSGTITYAGSPKTVNETRTGTGNIIKK